MKRGGPLKRKRALKRVAFRPRGPARSKKAVRSEAIVDDPRPATLAPPRKKKRLPDSVRAQVRARSGGMCETRGFSNDCGTFANHMHHVLPRSRGGEDVADNILHVCGGAFGGDGGCHSAIHVTRRAEAKRRGYIR